MANGGLVTHSRTLHQIYRNDIRSFFSKCLTSTLELYNEVTHLLLEKGLDPRPPFIPYPESVEFIEKQSFILEGLGRRKQLAGGEVSQLHFNIQTNQLGAALASGFSQVIESNKVRDYLLRGQEIAVKHIKVFTEYLENYKLPVPMSFNQEVTTSTESPFSDKLMLFHFCLMIYSGVANYGAAISESRRSDLVIDFSRLMTEVLKFAEDGANLMISNKWLEQPPLAANLEE